MKKLGLWVEEREALVPSAVWKQLPTTLCVSKGKRDLDSGHCGNDAFLHTDEFNMIQTYIYLLKHNMAS